MQTDSYKLQALYLQLFAMALLLPRGFPSLFKKRTSDLCIDTAGMKESAKDVFKNWHVHSQSHHTVQYKFYKLCP